MKIIILGAGPAGLYCGLLLKKAHPAHEIEIIERNPAEDTYGWGVVFSDRTLASFQRADYQTYEQIASHFVIWDAIDVYYRDQKLSCGGHVIASISRKQLLQILQQRCRELDITLSFNREITSLDELPPHDLLIAADGINSIVRRTYAEAFQPSLQQGLARYIWLGARRILDAFTFIFRENEHGLFQVHAYPSSGETGTFIVECDEATWRRAGLDKADEATSLEYCSRLFAKDLGGAPLLSNNSRWINFATLTNRHWHHRNMVLLGDAVHTAHFSIGSGTKLAMEDAISLANALNTCSDLETALNVYEAERKPVVEIFQQAALESQRYFETLRRYLNLEPLQFTFQLLTRSGRINYDDLRLRDPRFGESVDRWFASHVAPQSSTSKQLLAPTPLFGPFQLRELTLPNRLVHSPRSAFQAEEGLLQPDYAAQLLEQAASGAGLLLTEPVAVSEEGRITPNCAGLYHVEHLASWKALIKTIRTETNARVALQLGHAGPRGATRPRTTGLDRPLKEGGWPLLAASTLPYTPRSVIPEALDRAGMERVQARFVRAARLALAAEADLLQLNFAHGYLLASFISPLTNQRRDDYGGSLRQRLRFPLEVLDAVRASWPLDRPLVITFSASDCVRRGGLPIEEAIEAARIFKEHGCDMITVAAGQTTPASEPAYSRGFLTAYSDRIRNEAGIPTLTAGYLTTGNEINTILAAGRSDLCLLEQR